MSPERAENAVQSLCLNVGGLTISMVSEEPDLPIVAGGAMAKFVEPTPPSDPDAIVRVRWGDAAPHGHGELVFDSGVLWRLYRHAAGYTFVLTSSAVGPLPYVVASFDPTFRRGEVRLRRSVFASRIPLYPLEYPLDELLAVHLLALGRGVQVHALGLVTPQGDGFLFAGQSGAGKTTMARLWQPDSGVRILSDERIMLRKEGGRVMLYGTPWHGEGRIANPGSAPLRRIFMLRHGPRNELTPQRPIDAVARLFACTFPPFHNDDALAFSLRFLDDAVAGCASDELSFVPDGTAPAFVQSLPRV
jgi:hypothetical protein